MNGCEISGMNNESRKFLNITRVSYRLKYDVLKMKKILGK
jgi:hypothetical protein